MIVTRDNFDDLLLDYLYGELAPEQQEAFEAYVAEHPEAQQTLAELQSTRRALSPLAADLEPSQITTNRVLARARDAAEGMALSGRLWGLFPRYATAMAALLAVAVGITIVAPRDATRPSEYQIAKGEGGALASEANEALHKSEADARAALSEESEVSGFAGGVRADAPAAPVAEPAPLLEQETPLDEGGARARRTLGALDELKKPESQLELGEEMPVAAPAERRAFGQSLADDKDIAGRESTGAGDTVREEGFALNRLAFQAPLPVTAGGALSTDAVANGEAVRADVAQKQAASFAETQRAPASAREDAEAPSDLRGPDARAGQESAVQYRQEDVAERDGFVAGSAEPPAVAVQLNEGLRNQVAGNHAVAVEYFQTVVAQAPAAPVAAQAQFETGRSLVELGDCANAIVAFQDVLDNAPAFPRRDDVLLAQAACLLRVGNERLAEERYRMAEAEFPTQLERIRSERRLSELQLEGRVKKARTTAPESARPVTTE